MKIYMRLNGVDYYDYDVILTETPWRLRHIKDLSNYTVIDKNVEKDLENITSLLDMQCVPQKGSSVHIVPDCPYALNDIRNNYTIKRSIDTADFNVFSEYSKTNSIWIIKPEYYILPNLKTVIIFNGQRNYKASLQVASAILGKNITEEDVILSADSFSIYASISNGYFKLLKKELTKPCVYYKNLDINSSLELTEDALQLVYASGKVQSRQDDSVNNFILQLNMLNQHNWREYPGTVNLLLNNILPGCCGVRNYVHRKLSQFPKQIKPFFSSYGKDLTFKNEKDYEMSKRLIYSILCSENIHFTTCDTLLNKLREANIDLDIYNKFFKTTVKIDEREYKE